MGTSGEEWLQNLNPIDKAIYIFYFECDIETDCHCKFQHAKTWVFLKVFNPERVLENVKYFTISFVNNFIVSSNEFGMIDLSLLSSSELLSE